MTMERYYWHITPNLLEEGKFYPRIPSIRGDYDDNEEDSTIPRICAGKSIEDCLTAIPEGGIRLMNLLYKTKGFIKVFKIDTQKLGITEKDIINDEYLFNNDLVRDALHTNECWITKAFTVPKEDTMIIKVENWNEESEDIVPPDIWNEAMEGDGDYFELYEERFPEDPFIPCMTVITDLKYIRIEEIEMEDRLRKDGVSVKWFDDDEYDEVCMCSYSEWNEVYDSPVEDFINWCEAEEIVPISI